MTRDWKPPPDLIMEMRALVCRVANSQTPLHATHSPTTGDWDLGNPARSAEQRKHDYLTALSAGHLVQAAVEMAVEMAIGGALRDGADYAEIGAAEGISRQAARQRHQRRYVKRRVRLIGGPRNGDHAYVFGREREIRRVESAGFWDNRDFSEWDDWDDDRPNSVYRVKYGAPEVFEFLCYEDAKGNAMTNWDRRPRVHQLARYWLVDPRSVIERAREIDSKVKSPSSRVDLVTVESLREVFSLRRSAPPSVSTGDTEDRAT
jgi:hypothetical protein